MNEIPPMLRGSLQEQVNALRDYLVREKRAQKAEIRESTAQAMAEAQKTARTGGKSTDSSGGGGEQSQAGRLRALILKTAEETQQSMDELAYEMRGSYLAKSEFGTYQQELRLLIEATAQQIVESYGFAEEIAATEARLGQMGEELAGYRTEINGEIRRGYLTDPETGETVLGIAIAQRLQFTGQQLTDAGWSYYELSPGQTLGLYTSTGWQFWVNGRKVGWFDSADGMLHTVSQVVEEEIRIGDWAISAHNGFGIKYTG